jgi:hypothetical protein
MSKPARASKASEMNVERPCDRVASATTAKFSAETASCKVSHRTADYAVIFGTYGGFSGELVALLCVALFEGIFA